jgi:mono/diheme cytochrome c family protein/peptidoglycan hydrolase CwlO-like protein
MLERKNTIPIWVWIVGAVLVIGCIFAGYRTIETRQRLEAVKSKLVSVKHSAAKTAAEADAQINELQIKVNQATSEIGQLRINLDTAQSQLKQRASSLETMRSELESAKQSAAKTAVEADAQINGLQTKLDQTTSEIGQLRNNLDTAQSRLKERASSLERMRSELESAKQSANRAVVEADAEIMTPLEREASTPKGQLKSPFRDFASVAEEGRRKYMAAGCNGCHGGGGGGGMAAPLTNPIWIYGDDDDTLFRLITLGTGKLSPDDAFRKHGYKRKGSEFVVGPMPHFGEIIKTDDDLWKIIAWMRTVHCSRRVEDRC